MAVPNIIVTLGGTNYPIPQPGSTPWGQNVTNWIIAASGATGFLQANGSIVFSFLKSASANAAALGVLRFANGDTINWRNASNSADDKLFPGVSAAGQSFDDLYWYNASSGLTTQLTGNPAAFYTASAAVAWTVAPGTVTGFNTLQYDTDAAFNTGTGVYTVPVNKGGLYMVVASLVAAAGAVSTSLILSIQINGATQVQAQDSCDVTNPQTAIATGIFNLASAATIKVVQASSVANAGVANGSTNFIVIKRIS